MHPDAHINVTYKLQTYTSRKRSYISKKILSKSVSFWESSAGFTGVDVTVVFSCELTVCEEVKAERPPAFPQGGAVFGQRGEKKKSVRVNVKEGY